MQELGKVHLNINIIPNGLENYMSFNINNELNFIDRIQFLSSSLGSLVKNLDKRDFEYLGHKFDDDVLDLVMQKGFYPYEYRNDFENFKEQLPNKKKFYSSLIGKKISDKDYEHVLKVWNKKR